MVRQVIELHATARVGDSGVHLASIRRPGMPAHLWDGVQFYERAIQSCLRTLRENREKQRG